jgi:hypothetical protein
MYTHLITEILMRVSFDKYDVVMVGRNNLNNKTKYRSKRFATFIVSKGFDPTYHVRTYDLTTHYQALKKLKTIVKLINTNKVTVEVLNEAK